ncbi:MAG: hypothetical protein ACI9MC_000702 [Kiritimatiellia bacterium]|jgi:hypothetical protein
MGDARRATRLTIEDDVLVECRVEGRGGLHLGMVVNASYFGVACEVTHFVEIEVGDEVAIRFPRDELNSHLQIGGMTAAGRVVRVQSSPRGVSFALELPDLRSRVNRDLSSFLGRYTQAA